MPVFEPKPLQKPNFLQRLFNRKPSANALIEINNLLADAQQIREISTEQVTEIADRYNVNLRKQFRTERTQMFREQTTHILSDNKVTDQEVIDLKHLRDLLLLTQSQAQQILQEEAKAQYGEHVREALEDNRLSEEEKSKLEQVRKNLMIDEETANKLYADHAKEKLQNYIEDAASDERLAPSEEEEMHDIADSLGIELSFDENTRDALDRFRLYWQIENGEIPEIKPDINLFKGEKLYFKTAADWIEHKQVTRRLNYGGPTARIKLAKGIYYRAGSLGVKRTKEDVWQRLDSGVIYLTERRIIFMGERGNKNIRLNRILTFNPYSNGVDIQKSSGKSPFLEFSHNVDIFSMILARLLFEE